MIDDFEFYILCPYCMGVVDDTDSICPHCRWDMSNDAGFEMDGQQYKEEFSDSCAYCQAPTHKFAIICATCGQGDRLCRKVEMAWHNKQPNLRMASYREVETALKVTFPTDFTFYYMDYHGATPALASFDYVGRFRTSKRAQIAAFLALDAIVETALNELKQTRGEIKLVPFATVKAGGYLCFDYREGASNPSVVYWEPNIFRGRIWSVAKSISELMSSLK